MICTVTVACICYATYVQMEISQNRDDIQNKFGLRIYIDSVIGGCLDEDIKAHMKFNYANSHKSV